VSKSPVVFGNSRRSGQLIGGLFLCFKKNLKKIILKKFKFYFILFFIYLKLIFLYYFDVLILKNKKYYLNIFLNKKNTLKINNYY
jgi:hypothetical protein